MDDSNTQTATKTPEQRKILLAQTIQTQIVSGGRVESQGDFQAVVVTGHRVNHLLHLVLGLITFTLWWWIWLILAVTGGEKRKLITVDEFGNVLVQKV